MASGLDFEDFLGHKGSESGGGSFVGNWKEDGSIIVWLHPLSKIYALWRHRWLRLDTGDKDNPLSEFKTMSVNCLEAEAILKKQRFRNSDGTSEYPPITCPHCIFKEEVRKCIARGEISWTDPLFRFEVDGGGEPIIVRAGGFTGMFQKREMTDREKAELKAARVKVSEAFKENGGAQLEYIIPVIKDAKPQDGPLILMEKTSLGDALKKALAGRMEEYEEGRISITNWRGEKFTGRAAGNPQNNPCAVKLTYDDDADFSAKYAAKVFDKKEPSAEVIEQFDADPPDVSRLIGAPNLRAHKKAFERYCVFEFDWDSIFKPGFEKLGIDPNADDETEPEDDLPEDWGGSAQRTPEVSSAKPPLAGSKQPEPEADNLVECDACQKPFADDLLVCPHCGAEYEEVNGEVRLKPKVEEPKPAGKRAKKKG